MSDKRLFWTLMFFAAYNVAVMAGKMVAGDETWWSQVIAITLNLVVAGLLSVIHHRERRLHR